MLTAGTQTTLSGALPFVVQTSLSGALLFVVQTSLSGVQIITYMLKYTLMKIGFYIKNTRDVGLVIFERSKIALFAIMAALSAILLSASLFLLVGCAHNDAESRLAAKGVTTTQITDINGRDVFVPCDVSRVATVGSAARLCVYAGAADKLIAVTEMEKPDIHRPYTLAYASEFASLPTTSNGNHINATDVDIEKLIELEPDIIISTRSAAECENLQEKSGIPVVGVYSQDEIFGGQLEKSISLIGNVCGCADTAENTLSALHTYFTELNLTQKRDTKFYRGAINFKGTKGLTGTVSKYAVYQAMWANNVADSETITGGYDTSIEQIIAWNPDVAVFDFTNLDKVRTEYGQYSNLLLQATAFKNGETYCVAPFNNNGTNVEYGICEAYFTAALLNGNFDGAVNAQLDGKFKEICSALLHKDVWPQLKEQGVRFEKVALAS